jgi:hypothetical protein
MWYEILAEFPNLASETFSETSGKDPFYNCIAFAASETRKVWWPFPKKAFWPSGVPRELTLNAFRAAYGTLGFEECNRGDLEEGFEKVAIYTLREKPTHAARQLPDGRWASKLGREEDIEHETVKGVSGDRYGEVATYLKRPR